MYLETQRLVIRPFVPEDAADLQEILGDAETMKYCEPAYTPEKTQAFLESFCIGRKAALAAARKDTGKVIGYLLFNALEPRVYEMGWFFNRACWRQGYATEACGAVIAHAFREGLTRRIFAETIDAVSSAGLMEKLGMRRESVQPHYARDNDGNWADLYLYGLSLEDWQKISEQNFGNIENK